MAKLQNKGASFSTGGKGIHTRADEDFYVGARYNTMKADMGAAQGEPNHYEVDINRVAIAAGWYMTKNVMAKIEYVNQKYNGFPARSIQDGAEFNGLTLQGSIAF